MDFIKKNYEKILLGVVLLGMVLAIGYLPFKVAADRKELDDLTGTLLRPRVKELTNLDLTLPDETLKRMATPALINFSEPNKLFNPMPWQKTADNKLIPGTKVGPGAAIVTNITPLYLKLTLDGVNISDSGPKYVIGVERQADPIRSHRTKKGTYCKLNDKTDAFVLIEVKGKPEDPTAVVVTLNDTGERAVITKDQPFLRVDGYMADIRYEPERRFWLHQRVGNQISFNGEDYKIMQISKDEVVLAAKSNQKKWTIKPAPTADS